MKLKDIENLLKEKEMDWKNLYLQVMPNIDFWANYVSKRTALEKEDISQQLLLRIWEVYCKKGKDVKKSYIQYCLKYATIRIFHNYFRCNEVMLSVLSIESVGEDELEHKDVEFYLQNEYLKADIMKLIEVEYEKDSEKMKYVDILNSLLEGKKQAEIATMMECGTSKVKYMINSKIKPVIAKKY